MSKNMDIFVTNQVKIVISSLKLPIGLFGRKGGLGSSAPDYGLENG